MVQKKEESKEEEEEEDEEEQEENEEEEDEFVAESDDSEDDMTEDQKIKKRQLGFIIDKLNELYNDHQDYKIFLQKAKEKIELNKGNPNKWLNQQVYYKWFSMIQT